MNIEDVRGLIAAAELGHVGAAADELGISQSALTRRIQRVERQVGAPLFDRHGRGLRLNARGAAFLGHGRAMIAAADAACADVARQLDPERGTVRLDFMHSLGTWMVPDLLRDYRQLHPLVQFELHQGPSNELIARVLDDETDLALVGPRPVVDGLGWIHLARQRLAVAYPAGATGGGGPVALADVADSPWVGMLPGYGTRTLLDELASEAGFSPRLVFESMELTTVAGLVSAGLGVALLPMDDPYLAVSGVQLRPIDPPAFRDLGVVWRKEASPAPPVDYLREFIAARR